jgi:hypothetical protein
MQHAMPAQPFVVSACVTGPSSAHEFGAMASIMARVNQKASPAREPLGDRLAKQFHKRFEGHGVRSLVLTEELPRSMRHDIDIIDYRFLMFGDFLRKRAPTDCVFFADITDVSMLRSPAPLCRLSSAFVASDACQTGPVKKWMRSHYLARSDVQWPDFVLRYLSDPRTPLFNVGIMGGHVHALRPFFDRFIHVILQRNQTAGNQGAAASSKVLPETVPGAANKMTPRRLESQRESHAVRHEDDEHRARVDHASRRTYAEDMLALVQVVSGGSIAWRDCGDWITLRSAKRTKVGRQLLQDSEASMLWQLHPGMQARPNRLARHRRRGLLFHSQSREGHDAAVGRSVAVACLSTAPPLRPRSRSAVRR